MSDLLRLQRDMHFDWLLADYQGTAPYDLGEAYDAFLFLLSASHGKSNGSTCHLQVGHPWHHALPFDYVIGQKKLVTAKGRTELLFEEIRAVLLHQRMQRGNRRDACRCEASCWLDCQRRDPVAFAGKWIGRQANPMRQALSVEEHPIDVHSSHPYPRNLVELLLLAPDVQQGLSIFIAFKEDCVIACGTRPQATLYLTCIYSC